MPKPTGKLKFAYTTIASMESKITQLEDRLKRAYCKEVGADSITGLDSCDDYKEWLNQIKGY